MKSMNDSENVSHSFIAKMKQEKRRRHQLYSTFDFYLSSLSMFDFFSFDSFELLKDAYVLSKFANQEKIGTDFLLLAFFQKDSNLLKILKECSLDHLFVKELVKNLLPSKFHGSKEENEFLSGYLKHTFSEEIKDSTSFVYSRELEDLFKKAAENALIRFKTPIISTEILFITLMEDKKNKGGKLIRNYFESKSEWFLLRYRLLKQLHSHESTIKGEVVKNQHYFAYLLKTKLKEPLFDKLIKQDKLGKAVNAFRNFVFKDILKINFLELLNQEIYQSIELNKNRKYSS